MAAQRAAIIGTGEPGVSGSAAIIGTGLIGGSIGLALRERGWWVSGTDQDGVSGRRGAAPGRAR